MEDTRATGRSVLNRTRFIISDAVRRASGLYLIAQPDFAGTVSTEPHSDVRRIRPEEGSHLARHFHRRVIAQALQGRNVPITLIKFPLRTLLSVYALAFAHGLFIDKLLTHIHYSL
jgi:hypothetical protein